MTKTENKELMEKHAVATSRLVTKTIPVINKAFEEIALVDLLMQLPITFEFEEVDLEKIPEGKLGKVTQKDIAIGGYITRDNVRGNPDRLVVFIVFNKDIKMTWDQFFEMLLSDSDYQNEIAFTYLHEAMHILLRHYDYYLNEAYARIVRDIRPDMTEKNIDEILNYGFDYWINAYIIEQASGDSYFNRMGESTRMNVLYDKNLSPRVKTMNEIIETIARDAIINNHSIMNTANQEVGMVSEITINGNTSRSISVTNEEALSPRDSERPNQPVPQDAEQDIQEILESTKNNLLEKTRGQGSSGAFSKLGVDYAVPTDWFKALKGSIFTIVSHHTNRYEPTWSKLKSKFKHIAPFPGKKFYDADLAAVISIDQSGSMSNSDLEKINYVVTALAKKTVFTEILLHDTRVASRKKFSGKKLGSIKEFVTNRVACGGTSHSEVFSILNSIKKENKKLKFIYLSFSDNYSDIESVWDKETFKDISSYWITTDERNTVNVPGMQISLEHGLLKA